MFLTLLPCLPHVATHALSCSLPQALLPSDKSQSLACGLRLMGRAGAQRVGKRNLGVLPGLREEGELTGVQGCWEVTPKPLPRVREVHKL